MRTLLAAVLVVPLALTGCARRTERVRPVQEVDGTTAHRIVRAGVLRTADLPGYRVAAPSKDKTPETKGCMTREVRDVAFHEVTFERRGAFVASTASAAASRAAVAADEKFIRDEFPDCWERVTMAWLAATDVSVRTYTTKRVPVRVPGADAAFGYDIRLDARRDDVAVPLRMTVVAAIAGYGEVLVISFGAPAKVPSVVALRPVVGKAVRRVVAAQR